MTALTEYQRLECSAIWRDCEDGRRRGVAISLGDTSLVILDEQSGIALAHWSLPAIRRLNPGKMPALYAPDIEAGEQLEVEEEAMIAALEKVENLIRARKPHPGRLRSVLVAASGALVAGLAVFWLPGALVNHTAEVIPTAKRTDIGHSLLKDVERVTGSACHTRLGDAALQRLALRLATNKANPPQIYVMPQGIHNAAHLPGRIVLLDSGMLESSDSPDLAAGFVLAERLRAELEDPMRELLHYTGLPATFRLLTSGDLPANAMKGYAETLLTRSVPPLPAQLLSQRFTAAGVSPTSYSAAIGAGSALADAGDGGEAAVVAGPVMSDEDWISLQNICG